MNKHPLLKKLSVGISFGQICTSEIVRIIESYKDYIHDIYFSPVEDIKFQTRHNIYSFEHTTNFERQAELAKIIQVAKQNNVKINLTLNTFMATTETMLKQFVHYKNLYSLDYVTTLMPIAISIKEQFSNQHIICSYNEGIISIDKLQEVINSRVFSTIVIGTALMRNFDVFKMLKSESIALKLMVNNGCMKCCANFCKKNDVCKSMFDNLISKNEINHLYATQSLFPEELYKYYVSSDLIDTYKLSSRPITYNEFDNLLQSYISNNSKEFIDSSIQNYHLYARLGHFTSYYSQLNYDKIMQEKENIWKNFLIDETS